MTHVPSPFDMHELLSAQDFVRRLARSLVFDQGRVDDVVQEAWVAAMKRPPRERTAAASWFRSVLHNLARRHARDEKRRRAREQAAARPEALPSAADVLAREQQRREVVDAVMALPEPYRGTVLARYFDELEPKEIARARGVPAATVRSQLHRALELLRQRLDERHGSRRAWSLLLVPLMRPARAAGSGLLTAAGALLMAKVLFGAGALALAVLTLLWLGEGAGVPVPAGAATSASTPTANAAGKAATETTPPGERIEVPTRAPTPATTAAIGTAGLRGRVVYPDGRPAPGVPVRVLGIDGLTLFADAPATGDQRTLALARGEARTSQDGTFTVTGLPPRTHYAVDADAGGPDRTLRFAGVTPLPDETADLGDVVLAPKGSIAGRAVDSRGEPVAAAEVLAFDLPAVLLAALPFDRFAPEHGGMLSIPVPADASSVDPKAYRDRLQDYFARDLFMRAGLDREPGLGTFVVDRLPWLETLWRELPIARTATAADGTFTVRGVEPGANVLLVRKQGLDTGSKPRVNVAAGEQRHVGDVRLPDGEVLRGTVRDASGKPVAGAEVRVAAIGALGYRGVAFSEAPVRTGTDGSFRVTGLARGRAFAAARASERESFCVIGPVEVGDDVELRLPSRSELRIRVERADGAPVSGLALELFNGPQLYELRRAGLQQRLPLPAGLQPDAEGLLSLGMLPKGCYTLHAESNGSMPAEAMLVLPQEEAAKLTLRPAVPLLARVRTVAGEPVAGARIWVRADDANSEAVLPTSYGLRRWHALPLLAGATDAAGELRLQCPANRSWLFVTHPGHGPESAEVPQGAATVDITLPDVAAIQGHVFDHGVPADPRRFCVVASVEGYGEVPLPDLRAALRIDGSFRFANVAPAPYEIRAEPVAAALSLHGVADAVKDLVMPGFSGEQPVYHRIELTAGATATVEFDLDPNQPRPGEVPARLAGRALLDGVPLAGAELLRRIDPYQSVTAATVAADGSFATTLPPGEQHLVLRKSEEVWEGDLTLRSGDNTALDLAMRTGSIAGTAKFTTGLSTAKHVVTADGHCNGGLVRRRADLDATGRFAFAGLPAGDWSLQASGPDGKSEPVQVQVTAGVASPPVQLELQETLVLSGRVEGDFDAGKATVFLHADNHWRATDLEADGSFHFGQLEAQVYTLGLTVGGRTLPLVPDSFDLRLGSQRDLRLRLGEAGK